MAKMPVPACLTCNDRGMVARSTDSLFGPLLTREGCPACSPEPPVLPGPGRESLLEAIGSARGHDVAGIAANVARSLVEFYSEAENQAFLAGCIAGAGFSRRMRAVPGILFTFTCGLIARQAYQVAADVHAIARAADGAGPPVA